MLSEVLSETALVVAHPDDEILWFSSLAKKVGGGFICFSTVPDNPAISAARKTVADEFPLPQFEFLNLTEAAVFDTRNWLDPEVNDVGLALQADAATRARYRDNFAALVAKLTDRLAPYQHVVTHNPWGEYGHEEHVQVYRAVAHVCRQQDKMLWYSNYCSDRSMSLMRKHIRGMRGQGESFVTDLETARELEELYRKHGCWTWPMQDYPYFKSETFIFDKETATRKLPGSLLSINYIEVDGAFHDQRTLTQRVSQLARRVVEGSSEASG